MATVRENIKNALTWFYDRLKDKYLDPFDKRISDNATNIATNTTDISGKAPTSHASSDTTYGVGTTSNYGHCRTINNLTTSSHTNGYALSAYQGYLLNSDISTANTNITKNAEDISTLNTDLTNINTEIEELSLGLPEIQTGIYEGDSGWAISGEATEATVTFPKTFSGTPTVVACHGNGSGLGYADCAIVITGIHRNEFTIRIINNSTVNLTAYIRWIAIYQP